MLQVESELAKFEVTLVRPGHDKINCIKAIRGCTNLGLREAKALADTVPQVLGKCTREYAESLRSEFNEVGATITVTDITTGEVVPALETIVPASTFTRPAQIPEVPATMAEHLDAAIQRLITGWKKLKELAPEIRTVQRAIKSLKAGEMVYGCTSFDQFCLEHLHTTGNGVRKMLAGPRKPSTTVLSRERRIQMAIANLDKLIKDDAPQAMVIAQHFSDLAAHYRGIGAGTTAPEWPNSRSSIVARAGALAPVRTFVESKDLVPSQRNFVERIMDIITRRAA